MNTMTIATCTRTRRRSLTAAVGLSTLALFGVLSACGSSDSPSSTRAATTTTAPSTTTTTAPPVAKGNKAARGAKDNKMKNAVKAQGAKALLKDKVELEATAAQALGILPADLNTELKGGKSIAQVAAEHNVELTKVTDALGADLSKRIDAAVARGTLTTEQANQAKQRLPMTIDKLVNRQGGQGQKAPATNPGTAAPTSDPAASGSTSS